MKQQKYQNMPGLINSRGIVLRPAFDPAGGCVPVRARLEPSPTAPPLRALVHGIAMAFHGIAAQAEIENKV